MRGADGARAYASEIADELRVKEVGFDEGPVVRVTLLPNLPVLGPRLGSKVADVRAALQSGDYEELPTGGVRVAGLELGPDDLIRGESLSLKGWAIAQDGKISIAMDTSLDDDLRLEGKALDMIRKLNDMRKAAGLELTDRIHVVLPAADADLLVHGGWIKDEVLAVSIEVDGAAQEARIAKA